MLLLFGFTTAHWFLLLQQRKFTTIPYSKTVMNLRAHLNQTDVKKTDVSNAQLLHATDESSDIILKDSSVEISPKVSALHIPESTSLTQESKKAEQIDQHHIEIARASTRVESVSNPISSEGLSDKAREARPVLVVCVLTAARPGDSYLKVALHSLRKAIRSEPLKTQIQVSVIDVSVNIDRSDTRSAQDDFPEFKFEKLSNKSWEPCSKAEMLLDSNEPGRPPCSVRQQTRDVLASLDQCSRIASDDGWVTIMEDDTELCPNALNTIATLLRALSERPAAWRYAAFSSYFSGASFPKSALSAFLGHAWSAMDRRPIDHLVFESWAKGNHFEYAGNLLQHRGRVSVFEYRNTDDFRRLYDGMRFSPRQADCSEQPLPAALDLARAG